MRAWARRSRKALFSAAFSPSDPLQKFRGKERKRVVARAHNENPVAGSRMFHKKVAASGAIGKGEGLAALRADASCDVLARHLARNRPAEIDRLGHDEHVAWPQRARKGRNEALAHQLQRAKAVRLEHDEQPSRKVVQGSER